MKTLSLKLPVALDRQLATLARQRKSTKSAVIREALQAYLKDGKRPKPGSFMDLAGDLVGSLDSGIGDLSYNKKHMEGFGR